MPGDDDDEDPWRRTIAKELLDELVFPSLSPYVLAGLVLVAVMLMLMLANTVMLALILRSSFAVQYIKPRDFTD